VVSEKTRVSGVLTCNVFDQSMIMLMRDVAKP